MADARDREYALGIEDRGRTWFLSRAANFGNLMRTTSPFAARTFPSVAELTLWLDGLPAGARRQLADRPLSIIPLRIAAEGPIRGIEVKVIEAEMPGAAAHA